MKKVKLILFIICTLASTAFAQDNYFIKNIGIKEGLSNGLVDDMVMDGQGFIWVATDWGLNRIAGNKCTVFNTSNSQISNNEHVGLLYHPQSNSVWVYSKDGRVDVFDCKTQKFTHFTIKGNDMIGIAAMTMAADSAIWLANYNGDIYHYNPLNQELQQISKKQLPPIANGIRSITDDGKGNLYIGLRMDGLIIYNTHTKRSRFLVHKEDDPHSLPGNNVRSVFIDHLRNVWVGTNLGLGLYDPSKGTFTVFKHYKDNTNSLTGDNIQQIIETKDNILYITSDIGGISKLDLNNFNLANVKFEQFTKENTGLSSNNIRRILEDPFGNMWVSNYSTGVDFISKSSYSFMVLNAMGQNITNVSAIYTDAQDNLWIGQDNQISLYRDGSIIRSWNFSQYISNSSSSIYLFREDKQGNIWFGTTDNGILKLNPHTGLFKRIESTKNLDVNAICIDHNGKVWAGTEDGVYTIENNIGTKDAAINNILNLSAIPFSIIEDDYGRLWIGTLARGLFVFDKNKRLVAHLAEDNGFPSNSVNQLLKDEEGSIWVATHQGLVYIPNAMKPNNYTVYGENEGLKEGHLRAITQDRQGNIWASMFSGITCFDRNKKKFYNYDYNSGIPMGNFTIGAASCASSGILYFGSPDGICTVNPQLLVEQDALPTIQIIDCEQLESQSDKGKFINNIIPLDEDGHVHLAYDENTFKISFTSTNFAQQSNVEYSYLMKGLDDKWYEAEGTNEVTFRNLPSGDYTFKVRAKYRNQDWDNANVAELKVIIAPPLWLTWWAKLLYALIIGGIAYYCMRSYLNEMKLRNTLEKERWESQQKQELNEERLRFFTNITHELRTPLTLIMGPLEDLMADARLPQVLHKKVKSIFASSERLLNLINEILEFRKTETQNRRLTVAHADLNVFVKEIGCRFQDLNRNPNVTIRVNTPEEPVEVYFDSEVISTVINNLMSNAVKYTATGFIDLTLNHMGNQVMLSVKDTGYGISKEALPHIFDRYYQAKGMHQASGTGIGLALVKSLSALHEADLSVDSIEGKYTQFTFALNADNTYPNALHKEDAPILTEKEDKPETEPIDKDTRPLLLVVEDNDDIRQYIDESLCEDYIVIQARNGKEGRDLALQQVPDIIVSDIMMPEMDGIEMMKALKNDIRTSHIPIILLTAKTSPNDQMEGYDSGADSYLMKPFSANLLQSRIRNILSGRRRMAEYILHQNLPQTILAESEVGSVATSELDIAETIPEMSPLDKRFMEKLNKLIEDNMTVVDIDIAFMTDKMAMSHSSFYRKVKALTGVSANEYIRKVKLQRSMVLLQNGENNVTEVSMLTGFNNVGYFRKCFKKEFGISPSDVLKK